MTNFHKPEDSVFNIGEHWYASQDYEDKGVVILGKYRYSNGDYSVYIYYQSAKDEFSYIYNQNAESFQVRYTHSSERFKK